MTHAAGRLGLRQFGRMARIGSVKVPVLCGVERFASVHHPVSVIEGQLHGG